MALPPPHIRKPRHIKAQWNTPPRRKGATRSVLEHLVAQPALKPRDDHPTPPLAQGHALQPLEVVVLTLSLHIQRYTAR